VDEYYCLQFDGAVLQNYFALGARRYSRNRLLGEFLHASHRIRVSLRIGCTKKNAPTFRIH